MELLENLIPEKYLFALGWMIIHTIWQIAGIGLILWLILRTFQQKSAAFKYRLSIGALLLISTLAIGSFLFHLQGKPYAEEISFTQTELDYFITQGDTLGSSDAVGSSIIAPFADWSMISKRIETWIPFMVQLWILGAMLFLVRFGTSLADLRILSNKNHEMVDPKWMQVLEQLMDLLQLKKPIKLLKTIHLDMPVTYGVWKPVILIPASLFFQLSPVQLEAILAHELAHIKRYDYLVNLFQSLLEVIFFFHPVFWWINRTARELRENACDDMAINMGIAPKDLAHGLANVLNHAHKPNPEMAMAAAQTKNPTLDRIKRIMGVKTSPTQPTTLTSFTMMITLLIGATLMVGASDKQTVESWEDLMTTNLISKTIEGNWENGFQRWDEDTVPVKKEYKNEVDTTFERPLSPGETEVMDKILNESDIPWKEMGMVFKDMDFSFFSNEIKIGAPMIPPMDFDNIPKWEFDGKMLEQMVPDADFYKTMPIPDFPMIETNLYDFSFNQNFFRNDTSKMSKEEIRKWKEKYQVEMEKWAEAQKEFHSKMEPKMKEFQDKMREWEKANEPKMQEYRLKMEEWQKANEPKMKEFELKMKAWQEENQPNIEEFQNKMKIWEEENRPKMEEFQKKMEIWQKENEINVQEFQMKMKEWQVEYQDQLRQLKRSLKENSKNDID